MVKKWVHVFLLEVIFFVIDGTGQTLNHTAAPGFQTSNQHQDVTLSWQVSYTGVGFQFWNIYLYQENICLIRMYSGKLHNCDGRRRGLLVVDDTHLDYTVQNTSSGDAGQYTCAIKKGSIFFNDSNALLYIFDTPDPPMLSPSEPSQEGDRFTVKCQAASTSLPAVNRSQVNMVHTWCNNSEALDPLNLPERYSITSSGDPANAVNDLLVITVLSRHDTGSYTCKVHEIGSVLQSPFSNSYDLEPLYAPGLASSGEDQTIDTGNKVTLSCSADDIGRPDGSWIWITPGGAVFNTIDVGQLTITEVSVKSDDGEYSCHLNNQVGNGTRGYVTLTVQEMPLVDVIEDISFTNTELLNVSCEARARPECYISWKYANGSSLPSSVFTWTSSPKLDGKYTVTTSHLQWTAGSSPDDRRHKGGGITCVASNVVDDTTIDFILDVQFAPYNVQVTSSSEIIEYERLGPVLCSAVCNPLCTYSWYKGGTLVSSDAELMIHNVTRDDQSLYECRPDNGIPEAQTAHFNLTVLYGPSINTFEVVTSSSLVNQTDDVTVSCQTDSRPAPVITLIRPSGDKLVSSTSNTLEHTLTDIDCLDSGYYKCEAYNSKTECRDHKLLQIAVQCPPRKHSTSDVKVWATEGDTVMFSITAIASPQPTFMWFFNGTELLDQNYVTTNYSHGFVPEVYVNSTLPLYNVTRVDFGNYSVTASNRLGVMEDVVYLLIPAGKPTAPSQLVASHTNAVSITTQWTSGWNRGGVQVFTLMYRRSDSDDSYANITGISDPGQEETVTSKARNLTSDSSYDFIVQADNQHGSTQSQLLSATTTAQPDLGSEIVISGNMATITWSLHSYSGPITRVDVNSCVSDSTNCIPTTKWSPITSTVEVAVPKGGSSYTFEFLVYDGDDLLLSVNHIAKVDGGSLVGIIVGVVVVVVVLVVAAVIGFVIWRRKSQPDARKKITIGSELGHVNPVMVTDDDISLTANGKHDTISEGHQMVVENTLYASSGSGGGDHMDQPYAEVPVVTGNRVTGAKAPGKKSKPKGKKGKLPIEDTFSPYEDVDGTDKPKGVGPVDSLLPEYAEVDRSQKPKKAPQLAMYADVNVVKKNKHAKTTNKKPDIVELEVVKYEEVDFKKKPHGAPAAASGSKVAVGADALPEYGQVDFAKKHKQDKAAKPSQLEEYAQVDFSKKNKKGKKPKPEATPPRPPRAASVDEGERAQSPPDHQPQYGIEGTLYADLDLINSRPTRAEPTVHANLEPSEYASIDALRLTTRPADQ